MRVSLEQGNGIHTEKNVSISEKRETVQTKNSVSGVNVDLFSNETDKAAYKETPKNQNDIQKEASMTDIGTNSDYRIVMSNCMSDEDFSRLLKEGTHPGNTDIKTVVTIVDTIKAELLKSGKSVSGYTDDIDKETLAEITGSETFAEKLMVSFEKKDIPLTRENAEMTMEIYDRLSQIDDISEDAVKYMVENNLMPTADNLYKASFSVKAGDDRQGSGYFANDMQGYYSQKAEVYNWSKLQPQMEKIIKEAGYEVSDDTLTDGMWIIKNGIPFTVENFEIYEKIKDIDLKNNIENIFDAVAAAIADGRGVNKADLSDTRSMMETAAQICDDINAISEKAVDLCVDNQQTINLRNLMYWQKYADAGAMNTNAEKENHPDRENAHLKLEEVRLKMSVEANYRLLKSGLKIDTTDFKELIEQLDTVNRQREEILFGNADNSINTDAKALFEETVHKTSKIPVLPAVTITAFINGENRFTLNNVYETGTALSENYRRANRSYETMMTMPRADLGDSIKKAFRNVDDILADMEYTISEENRKAVRTLGYNNMPLTDENIKKVIDANRQVANVLDKLTPFAILKMIRDGKNPLQMDMTEAEQYLRENAAYLEGDNSEKYGKYLYTLEKNQEITSTEREAYIGVLRLIYQIQKSDGGAVGNLVNSNKEINFKNLLSALRSQKKGHMDTIIDTDTGFFEGKTDYLHSISSQIERAFKEQIKSLKGYEKAEKEYEKDMLSDIQNLAQVSDNIIEKLIQNDLPVSADNLMSANQLVNMKYQLFTRIKGKFGESTQELKEYEELCREYVRTFESEEDALEGTQEFTEKVRKLLKSDVLEGEAKAIDIKELNLLNRQLSVVRQFAKEREYQVPVYLEGNYTTIHLKFVKGKNGAGNVSASMMTKKYGMAAGKFTLKDGFTEGYLVCEKELDTKIREEFSMELGETLKKAGLEIKKLHFITSQDINLEKLAEEEDTSPSSEEKTDTKKLYSIAKSFMETLQKIL